MFGIEPGAYKLWINISHCCHHYYGFLLIFQNWCSPVLESHTEWKNPSFMRQIFLVSHPSYFILVFYSLGNKSFNTPLQVTEDILPSSSRRSEINCLVVLIACWIIYNPEISQHNQILRGGGKRHLEDVDIGADGRAQAFHLNSRLHQKIVLILELNQVISSLFLCDEDCLRSLVFWHMLLSGRR